MATARVVGGIRFLLLFLTTFDEYVYFLFLSWKGKWYILMLICENVGLEIKREK